jgi:hypothetical protein
MRKNLSEQVITERMAILDKKYLDARKEFDEQTAEK